MFLGIKLFSIPSNNNNLYRVSTLSSSSTKPTLAVIGAGLAGLSAAWLMRDKYQVTLFERHPRAGMGVYTTDYDSNGISTRVDVPLRIFTPGYYPNLFALYEYLGIEMESSDHSAAFQILNTERKVQPFFQYKNVKGLRLKYLCRNSLSITGIKLVWAQYQFFKQIKRDVKEDMEAWSHITFGDYLGMSNFDAMFIERMLLPALAVTLTCDFESVKSYPADMILSYLTCGVMEQGIVRAKQGVDGIVPKLTQGYQVRCHEDVSSVIEIYEHGQLKVEVQSSNTASGQASTQIFDQVILASQANVSSSLLLGNAKSSIANQQSELLSNIPLESSTMVLHTDSDLVFDGKKCSPVSYLYSEKESRAATTVDLTKAFSTYKEQAPIYQTWHPILQPKKEKVLCQAEFTRPLVTLETRSIIRQLQSLNKASAIKICGSYMADKFPLLDAAVESSIQLARFMNVDIPWANQNSTLSYIDEKTSKVS